MVGLLKVKEACKELESYQNKTITFIGILPDLNEIDTYIFQGRVVSHQKYGEQFEVQQFERILPTEKDGMLEILASDMFKGIGKKTAEKLVSLFHEKTFDVILHRPSDLLLVPGIKEKQVEILHETLTSYQGSYETILKLTNFGFSTRDAMKIYHYYKDDAKKVIDEDIYQIFYDISDISYQLIDHLALQKREEKNSVKRIRSAIIYIMRTLCTTYGHTYLEKEDISYYFYRVLNCTVEEEKVDRAFQTLKEDARIVIREDRYYLKEYYDAEIFIAKRLRFLAHEKQEELKKFDVTIKEIEKKNKIFYNKEQKQAIYDALSSKVMVITGGPGTGKTTIIKGIIDAYQALFKPKEESLALLAPTGRASKRMSEAAEFKASTIHRFLKWNKENDRFQINEYNKSKAEFVIIDEASMLDVLLLSNLLKGLSSNTKIIFVGDMDQLPSVGPGEVLKDMIESKELKVLSLNMIYRQKEGSKIVSLAHNIRKGIFDSHLLQESDDILFLPCSEMDIIKTIEKIGKKYNAFDLQVLAPMYKTKNGIDNINLHLQELWNGKEIFEKGISYGDVVYREHDKVIQLSNMPDSFVFNGDIGVIQKVKVANGKEIYIDFDDNLVKYSPAMFSKFSLAYAISIHKSQGSEFDTVLIPLSLDYRKMLYRKLIYTAVTRCKKHLIFVGNQKALEIAIQNNVEQKRKTSLAIYLKNGIL